MVKKALAPNDKPVVQTQRPVSKSEKTFNSLVEKIQARRARLAEWEAYSGEFERKYNGEFIPLRRKMDDVQTQMVLRLDQSHGMKGLTNAERTIIEDLITFLADQVLMSGDDPVVVEIYERYNPPDPAAGAAVQEELKSVAKDAFAFDIPEAMDMSSPEDVMQYIQDQLDQQEHAEQARSNAREEHHAERKKAARRTAAEARERAEEAEVHQSIREVYRKLASALHPDREPDTAERERKATLMQRVNRAYASRSLLDLLEIQLELEHIDQAALEKVSDERLKRWNKVLKEQLEGLDLEIFEIDAGLQMRCGMTPDGNTSPKIIKRALGDQIARVERFVQILKEDLRVFDDINRLKPWLKEMKTDVLQG